MFIFFFPVTFVGPGVTSHALYIPPPQQFLLHNLHNSLIRFPAGTGDFYVLHSFQTGSGFRPNGVTEDKATGAGN
jgi:hypothetical protein